MKRRTFITSALALLQLSGFPKLQETIKPTVQAPNAGKTVQRRYTDIWLKNENSWQLIARQSTVFAVE